MKRSLAIAIAVAVAVVVGVGGFFGGVSYGKGRPTAAAAMKAMSSLTAEERSELMASNGDALGRSGPDGTNGGAGGAGRVGGGFTTGSIVSKDADSVTVKLSDGSTKIVLYSNSTTISVTEKGSSSELVTGETVSVTGTSNSDGSITATQIQVGEMPSRAPASTTSTTAGSS